MEIISKRSSLNRIKKDLKTADYLLYLTYPVIKDKNILMKVLEKVEKAVNYFMEVLLKEEYKKKKIKLSKDKEENFESFIKISKEYDVTPSQISEIKEIIKIGEMHKKSPMEFSRKEKFVMMYEDLNTRVVNVRDLKKYIHTAKELLKKI